jgi:hypothetical protein
MNKDTDHLLDRWRRIIQRVARGEDWMPAARAQGCSSSYARVIRTLMMKNSAAARYLASIQAEARSVAVYGVVEAMAQAQKGIDLAEKHHNPMAFIKGCELRAKLSGLLIDRTEVMVVDLKGSLEQAKSRVLTVINGAPKPSEGLTDARVTVPGPAVGVSADGSIKWAPHITGEKAQ